MRHRPVLASLFALSVACGRGNDELACNASESGTYDADGTCFGMTMTVQLTFDTETCTFTLGDWSMKHGGMPEAGAVDGDQVTLSGGDFEGCPGTVDGDTISGMCPADGCVWELSLAD